MSEYANNEYGMQRYADVMVTYQGKTFRPKEPECAQAAIWGRSDVLDVKVGDVVELTPWKTNELVVRGWIRGKVTTIVEQKGAPVAWRLRPPGCPTCHGETIAGAPVTCKKCKRFGSKPCPACVPRRLRWHTSVEWDPPITCRCPENPFRMKVKPLDYITSA